jgi:polysaccharide biosynthesis/export protein
MNYTNKPHLLNLIIFDTPQSLKKMIFNRSYSQILWRFFFASILLFALSATSNAQGIDPNNLSSVRIDELSDEQVMAIVKQGEASGSTIEQAQDLALKKGLPSSELTKLKERIAKIQSEGGKGAASVKNPASVISNKAAEKANYSTPTLEKAQNEESLNQELKSTIYGQEIFRKGSIKVFDNSTDAKAPSNYIIGIGDELGISVFGYSYYNEILKVDSRGAINPNQMGPIFIKGLTFERAKSLVRSKMSQFFDLSNNKLEITLAYSRSITVNIVGEVVKPGSYKLPATNTAFNALILASGPSDIGTLRNIQIRRDGKVIKTLDVYAFLTDPNSKQDFYLEDNDYIVVPSINKLVKLSGEVNRSTQYELIEKDGLTNLLKYAGGLKPNAYKEKVQIIRRSAVGSNLIDVNLDSLMKVGKDFALMNGDEILVKNTNNEVLNKITIKGAVNFEGDFNLSKNDKVSDLIKKAGGLKAESNINNAYIVRTKQDQTKEYIRLNLKEVIDNSNSNQNIKLQPQDVLTVYSNRDNLDSFKVQVFGSVKKEGVYNYIPGMTLGDALFNAGGLKIEAENLKIEIARLNYFSDNYTDGQDVRVIVEKIKLSANNFNLTETEAQLILQPFDQIFVRAVPNFELQQNVTLRGEVKYPGVYTLLNKDERIDDLIRRAGGLTKFAFPESATLYRPGLTGGYIVMKLKSAMASQTNRYNYVLKAGDTLTIPTVSDYVTIKGTTVEYLTILNKEQVNAPFVEGRRAKFYINEFGNGFTKDSWRKKTYVIQPNAKVNRTKDFIVFKKYPKVTKGSTIYVVEKIKKAEELTKEKEPFDWNKFVENTTLKVTGLATFFILLNQINL